MDFKKSFGEKLKRLRKNRGFTQEQLAEIIEIDPRNLSRIEVGNSFVKAETMEKLLKALNVTTEELFSNDHIKEPKELIADINKYINSAKDKPNKLEKIHKMIRFIVDDE
ncbi:helix-turn-helix transcriptional regulator [bacterium]|nr:helix-turn-helix transcriptional regulator [bacterium]